MAREWLKSPVLSAPGCSRHVQIQNSKSPGCSTAQSVSGAIPALPSDGHWTDTGRDWTGIMMCLTWIYHVHLFPLNLPTAKILGIFLKFFIPENPWIKVFLFQLLLYC